MKYITSLIALLFMVMTSSSLKADPCGMVPPIMVNADEPQYLTRVGHQITYAFYKDGIEDVVLRPSFKGSVDEFGMLIPFPSVPAIRKAPDDIFQQLAMAVEPQKVNIDLRWRYPRESMPRVMKEGADVDMTYADTEVKKNEVRVVKKEAVGMYQVAVLEAGSSAALEKWMTEHQYVYPKGMDNAVNHYVGEKWVFVAVKAKVGNKQGVEPKPGMRKIKRDRPANSEFKGAVQAMGFRFKAKEAIIPMRLSSYNPGELHNIVYFFSDKASKISQLPEAFITKQIPGKQLYTHLTGRLPATYLLPKGKTIEAKSGEKITLPDSIKDMWSDEADARQRDPSRLNGKAKDLFFSDLLAVQNKSLEHAYELKAKELLNISEDLGLRGKEVDALIEKEIAKLKGQLFKDMEKAMAGMTLTVVEGDFPRMTIRNNDLTFVAYNMDKPTTKSKKGSFFDIFFNWPSLIITSLLMALIVVFRKKSKLVFIRSLVVLACLAMTMAPTTQATAKEKMDPKIKYLLTTLNNSEADIVDRGMALIGLKDYHSREALPHISRLFNNKKESELLRLWSGATLFSIDAETGLKTCITPLANWQAGRMQNPLNKLILEKGSELSKSFIKICFTHNNNNVRRMAAGFLGNPKINSSESRSDYLKYLSYSKNKAQNGVMWKGGALFIPGIRWDKKQGAELMAYLSHWMHYAEGKKDNGSINQVRNNIVSVGAQLQVSNWGKAWQMKAYDWTALWVNKFAMANGTVTTDKNTLNQALQLVAHGLSVDGKNLEKYTELLKKLHGVDAAAPQETLK